jgi:hypothetical protein
MTSKARRSTSLPSVLAWVSLAACLSHAQAAVPSQWASSVLGFSSQYDTVDWSAAQALGAPDTPTYGDIATAWAPATEGAAPEFISVGFAQSAYASGALVREVFGNGFVFQIDAIDTQGVSHLVWAGTDTSQQGAPADFVVTWAPTTFLVSGLTIHVDTSRFPSFEEVDAIGLLDNTVDPVPEPGTWALMAAGVGAVLVRSSRRRARRLG